MDKITVTLKKSLIGRDKKHIATANSLGLRKIGDSCILVNNPANLGKINKINYLV